MQKDIKDIAKSLAAGKVQEAFSLRSRMASIEADIQAEIDEVVRQAVIGYLKKGRIYDAREAERLFKLSKDSIDDTVKQAVLSSFRDGDMETIIDLKNGLPIPRSLARELIDYCASWGKPDKLGRMQMALV